MIELINCNFCISEIAKKVFYLNLAFTVTINVLIALLIYILIEFYFSTKLP